MEKEDVLRQIINEVSPASTTSIGAIQALTSFRELSKGEVFIKIKEQDHFEYFILKGVVRSFLLNPDGEEVTISFYQEYSVLSPHVTRTVHNISNLNFQALTDVELGFFNAHEFLQLMIDDIGTRDFANAVLKNELIRKVEKEIGLASLTAMERLIKFRDEFPGLENYVSHQAVASYLGITNISLSRLRGKISSG